jgi:hypothetical protein
MLRFERCTVFYIITIYTHASMFLPLRYSGGVTGVKLQYKTSQSDDILLALSEFETRSRFPVVAFPGALGLQ